MECEHCNKILSSLSSLNYHKKSAKYCLKLRGETAIVTVHFICDGCQTDMASQQSLYRHHTSCVKYQIKMNESNVHSNTKVLESKIMSKDELIAKLEAQILYLQEQLTSVAKEAVNRPFEDEAVIEMEIEDNDEEKKEEEYQLTPLDLGKGFTIEHREEDGYINVTNLCKAGGKQFKHWNSLDRTRAFLKVLSTAVGIPTTELIKLGTGTKFGDKNQGGTWVHPQVAINIAQWISPMFDVKVSAWVYEVMMTGKIDITATKSYRQIQEENKNHKIKIQYLTKKYVKSQPRTHYNERNVVYILTTRLLKTERRYIFGKATNLTSRLSTYNKDDEHEVVYYQECQNKEKMSLVETLVLSNLDEYREQANRDRFVLPENQKIDLFINTIKECVKFVK